MFNENEILEIKEYLDQTPETSRIYLGSDSKKFKKGRGWYARYTVVLVVHIAGCNGGKVFSYTETERVYDDVKSPRLRLVTEAYKVSEAYLSLADVLDAFDVEVHLDLNSNPDHFSNKVVKEAVGYVTGVTGQKVKIKPDAWAAAHTADHATHHGDFHQKSNTNRH